MSKRPWEGQGGARGSWATAWCGRWRGTAGGGSRGQWRSPRLPRGAGTAPARRGGRDERGEGARCVLVRPRDDRGGHRPPRLAGDGVERPAVAREAGVVARALPTAELLRATPPRRSRRAGHVRHVLLPRPSGSFATSGSGREDARLCPPALSSKLLLLPSAVDAQRALALLRVAVQLRGSSQGSCRCCVRTFGLQQTKVSADFCDRRVKRGQQTRVSRVAPRRNRYFLRGSRGLGPRHQCRWCSSVSRLCARNIRGFDCSFLLASRPQGPGRCAAAAAFGPAQRRTHPTSGLNCTVPLSEPAPACDPVRGHNFAGYTVLQANSWNPPLRQNDPQ